MIYSISGEVTDIGIDYVVVDTNGVGYLIYTTSTVLLDLHIGQNAVLYTSLIVREDSMILYGFTDKADRNVFNILLGVSGVGPKLALACLNVHTCVSLAEAVRNGDLKALEKIPGVGKKSAQRMLLEIGDKLGAVAVSTTDSSTAKPSGGVVNEQVIQALTQLGWQSSIAEKAVEEVSSANSYDDVATLLKATLVFLGEKRG
ncbi:Holliday junction branch migration protein RuvA [Actinomyces sp. zg-332]|uniref:Holliday junction branch migration protein RuvA n=1 Tax=Actinomyces sp. zg-332 TaxID=2708340 RepID=UPI00141DF2B7|nr:Holliday junction branch migration protein RuvA [Actinomyces sp. zg-332]QPK93665.1 Holliday junction branch migration protein RuvA [Actinomyces sp. zg-332]